MQAKKLIKLDIYQQFARLYGINPVASLEMIMTIYLDYDDEKNHKISYEANSYNLSNIEYVVIILYLEYLNLLAKEAIDLRNDLIKTLSFKENELVNRYYIHLYEKKKYEEIVTLLGLGVKNDLEYLNTYLLIPGVRFINSQLYYYGDV